MSSNYDAHAAEADPENTLLWRANRQRLEAEEIRDAITAVSGIIDLTAGGTHALHKDRDYVSNTAKRGGADYDRPAGGLYAGGTQLDV